MQIEDDGLRHTLMITNVKLEDSGEYSVLVNDSIDNNLTCKCTLAIKGETRQTTT